MVKYPAEASLNNTLDLDNKKIEYMNKIVNEMAENNRLLRLIIEENDTKYQIGTRGKDWLAESHRDDAT